MSQLAQLHRQLEAVRRRRGWARRTFALATVTLAGLVLLAAAMACDWLLVLSRPQRGVGLALLGAAAAWCFWRFARPWLGWRENELQLALWVQRRQHIDSDLVAALQFDTPEGARWGSAELEQAVIDRARGLEAAVVDQGAADGPPVARRLTWLAAATLAWVLAGWLLPEYVSAFFRRLLLANVAYPTRTVIVDARINGQPIDLAEPGRHALRLPAGAAVDWLVVGQGGLPTAGEARLKLAASGLETVVALAADEAAAGTFRGTLARLNDSVECCVSLGDAHLEGLRLVVVPPPVIEVQLEALPPAYTGRSPQRFAAGQLEIAVVEGSRVVVHVASPKTLNKATATIGTQEFALRPADSAPSSPVPSRAPIEGSSGERGANATANRAPALAALPSRWVLDTEATPLAPVLDAVSLAIDVVDEDRLALAQPVQAVVRVEPDQPPRVAAEIITPWVLPTAKPTIVYQAVDDFGLARISVLCQVAAADGATREEEFEIRGPAENAPLTREVDGKYKLDLTPLKLAKGDQVTVLVRAVDVRRPRDGLAGMSEPRVFQVTDQAGILAMMLESDQKTAEQLKDLIQRQLGIGARP